MHWLGLLKGGPGSGDFGSKIAKSVDRIEAMTLECLRHVKGGPGSGNFGHAGRPGEVGGSAPDGEQGSVESSPKVRQWAEEKFKDKQTAENFARWFGDSKVVDEDGNPQVVYHGTGDEFEQFSSDFARTEDASQGFFFASNPDASEEYAWKQGEYKGILMPVYLRSENPLTVDAKGREYYDSKFNVESIKKAKDGGYDGVVFRNYPVMGHKGDYFLVFSPTQIKSATGNSGTFDHDNPNITKSCGGFHQWMSPVKRFNPDGSKTAKSVDRIEAMTLECLRHIKGGPGSGNFGHAGRPGEVGGSAPDDTPRDVPEAPKERRDTDLVMLGKYDDWENVTGKRKVTLFHFSKEDRSDSGLQRKFAGTAGAGEEKRSFEYDKEGKLVDESAPIHAYMYGAKKESMVPGNVMHRIDTELNVIDTGSSEYQEILAEAQKEAEKTGRPMLAMARVIAKQRGYDALASTRHGIVQILRDVSPAELEVVGKKGASPKIGYTPKPPEDSDYVDEYKRRWETKLSNLAKEKPEYEMYSLQNGADVMVNMGLLSKEDRHAIVGSLVGSDLDVEKVNAKVSELISKIPKSAREKDVEYIKNYWKYAIIAGKSKEEIRANIEEQQQNLLKNVNTRVAIRVPIEFINSVIEDGRLKSQFETGESKGSLDPQLRRNVEYNGFGVPRDHPADKRPIYGYMADEYASMSNTTLEYYGGIALVMKDEVKERTTVTFGDSLDNGLPASDIKSPNLISMKVVEGVLSEESFDYIEAQLHGGVSIDDVKEVVISEHAIGKIIKSHHFFGDHVNEKLPFGRFVLGGRLLASDLKISVSSLRKSGTVLRTIEEWIKSDDFKRTHWEEPEGRIFAEEVEKKRGRKS